MREFISLFPIIVVTLIGLADVIAPRPFIVSILQRWLDRIFPGDKGSGKISTELGTNLHVGGRQGDDTLPLVATVPIFVPTLGKSEAQLVALGNTLTRGLP